MAYESAPRQGRIEGEDLGESRRIRSEIDKHMHALAAIIAKSLGESTDGVRLGASLIKFDNDKVIVETATKCYVSEDPPGISRPCTQAEKDSMIVCMAPPAPDELLSQ